MVDAARHTAVVRVTHWITSAGFIALLISGIAILLAHPRLYWGETGAVGAPSLIDLPLPFMLTGQSGWGRSLHFLAAWVSVLTGIVYVPRKDLLSNSGYNALQRLTYRMVVFGLFPLAIWSGLAMSPAVTSVWPWMVTLLGGTQSARTIHFFVAVSLVAFLIVHIVKVCLAGFSRLMRGMIIGRT